MTRFVRRLSIAAVILAVLGTIGWINRGPLLLVGMGTLVDIAGSPIGPTQDIQWASGADPEGRPIDQRPPQCCAYFSR